jgi:hypothetical protein
MRAYHEPFQKTSPSESPSCPHGFLLFRSDGTWLCADCGQSLRGDGPLPRKRQQHLFLVRGPAPLPPVLAYAPTGEDAVVEAQQCVPEFWRQPLTAEHLPDECDAPVCLWLEQARSGQEAQR